MRLGIVGHEAAKFTRTGESRARILIRHLIAELRPDLVVSGACPLGGVDVWAVEEAARLGIATRECKPRQHSWDGEYGFKARNLDIANGSDLVVCILADSFPATYRGRRFATCYHCKDARPPHIKSGGCWTAMRAKEARWEIVANGPALDTGANPLPTTPEGQER